MWEKYTNWELATRVPFIVAVPWKPATHGMVTTALVENVDLCVFSHPFSFSFFCAVAQTTSELFLLWNYYESESESECTTSPFPFCTFIRIFYSIITLRLRLSLDNVDFAGTRHWRRRRGFLLQTRRVRRACRARMQRHCWTSHFGSGSVRRFLNTLAATMIMSLGITRAVLETIAVRSRSWATARELHRGGECTLCSRVRVCTCVFVRVCVCGGGSVFISK